jgi:hypothetical protein
VGIVDDGKIKYAVAVFTPVTEERVRPRLKEISKKIHDLITNRNANKHPKNN